MSEEVKKCRKCQEEKPLAEFYVRDGRRENTCRACKSAKSAEYYRLNKDRINARRRAKYASTPRIRAYYHERYIQSKIAKLRAL